MGWSEKLTDRPVSHRTKGARDRYAQDEVERRTAQAAEQARRGVGGGGQGGGRREMKKSASLGEMRPQPPGQQNGQQLGQQLGQQSAAVWAGQHYIHQSAPSWGGNDGHVGLLHGGRPIVSSSLPMLPEPERSISVPSFLMAGGDLKRGEASYLKGRRSHASARNLKPSRQRIVIPPPPTVPITVEWPEGHARRAGPQQFNQSNAQQQQQQQVGERVPVGDSSEIASLGHAIMADIHASRSEEAIPHSHSLPVLAASGRTSAAARNARPPLSRLAAPPVARPHASIKPIWADGAVSDAQWFKEWLGANDGVRARGVRACDD